MPKAVIVFAFSTSKSMLKRSTLGMEAMAWRCCSPSMTKAGRIKSSTLSLFSRTNRREKSAALRRRKRLLGNALFIGASVA